MFVRLVRIFAGKLFTRDFVAKVEHSIDRSRHGLVVKHNEVICLKYTRHIHHIEGDFNLVDFVPAEGVQNAFEFAVSTAD